MIYTLHIKIIMIRPALWQLSKKSLSMLENAKQFSEFLHHNQVKPSQKKFINGEEFYTRLSVIILIFQLDNAECSLSFFLYFCIKIGLLFGFKSSRYEIADLVILLSLYTILPIVLDKLPLKSMMNWTVLLLYFFGGVSQRWLILQILTINSFKAINFGLLIIFSLGKLKPKIKKSKLILAVDILVLLVFKDFMKTIWIGLILLVIYIICLMDRRLMTHKKRYSHLFQMVQVQQFH